VFIDETWTKTNMAPLRGWSARGTRLAGKAPHGHWRTLTFLAALRCDRIEAPCLVDGPINAVTFLAYVRQFLLPTLKPGDVVVMDNLGSHKGKAIRQALRSAGAKLLFLPPLLARPQSHRTGLRQAQTWAAACGRAHRRCTQQPHRQVAGSLLGQRVQKLPRQLRICVNVR